MCKRRKKVILVTGIVFTIMVVGIVGIVLLDRQKKEPRIKELRVELGGKLTNNIKDYLDLFNYLFEFHYIFSTILWKTVVKKIIFIHFSTVFHC